MAAERARRSLLGFTLHTYPGYQAGWVHEEICRKFDAFLAAVARRESPRLLLFVPPRHGKSELVSRRGPAYAMGRHPGASIIACSYGADLASRLNRDVQRIIDSDRYREVFPGTQLSGKNIRATATGSYVRNSEAFEIVGHKGGYRSAGVGGGITGMGADVLLIDDPIKDAEQANSTTYRDKVWEWYTSTAYTRLMPGSGVLIVLTRWHEDDLAGRLLKAQAEGDTWEVISYPAIAEVDEIHRRTGEALHPERYPVDRLQAIRGAVGSYVWSALFQQRPSPADGGYFRREWFRHWEPEGDLYRVAPCERRGLAGYAVRAADCRTFGVLDLAFSVRKDADYTVISAWAVTPRADLILLDVHRARMEGPAILPAAEAMSTRFGFQYLAIESVGAQLTIVQEARRRGLAVRALPASTDKITRSLTAQVRMEAGQLLFPARAPWLADYEAELLSFPRAAHDDMVDVTSYAAIEVFWIGGSGVEDAGMRVVRETAEAAAQEARSEAHHDPEAAHWWGGQEDD